MLAQIGQKAPNLKVSKWVQGMDTNLDKQDDNIVLVEVFQVNCPGCFMYGIPESIQIYNKYKSDGVSVLGMATAFEDYDKNTVENFYSLRYSIHKTTRTVYLKHFNEHHVTTMLV